MVKQSPEPRIIEIKPVADPNVKVHPRTVSGLFNNWRVAFVWLTQIVFYGLCWLPWNGRQAVLFDLDTRRFYLFDLVLWPQDTIYLTWLLLLSALALFLFTALAGRLWCGYSCPQTVYTDIFLWVERWIEGDRPQRIKLDKAPNSPEKLRKKTLKHAIWLLIALWTGITFVGYFTPIRDLIGGFASGGTGPWEIFWILFYGAATYGMAGFMREHMCPYSRFQGVMFDPETRNVAYDAARGEPRGARRQSGQGDCIDCGICVQVCPTGIDIRDGLQYQCINCGLCVDACDTVMDKVGSPRGLIRFASETELASGRQSSRHWKRPRLAVYATVLGCFTLLGAWTLSERSLLLVDVLRDRGSLVRETAEGDFENAYTLKLMNLAEQEREFEVRAEGLPGIRIQGAQRFAAPAGATAPVHVTVAVPGPAERQGIQPIRFHIVAVDDPRTRREERSTFVLP